MCWVTSVLRERKMTNIIRIECQDEWWYYCNNGYRYMDIKQAIKMTAEEAEKVKKVLLYRMPQAVVTIIDMCE